MTAYYNENDAYAAQWLCNLIAAGHIAPGEVDERSIEDVRADDLRGFTQCHFFAGIGVWSYALRLAGWPDDSPVWTGSCPCQPFSAAGKGGGFDDERHLWPAWFHLIEVCRPPVIYGEQVASKDGLAWLDLVHTDMEGAGYAFGATDLCAAGFGAPHIRQRLFFVGHASGPACERGAGSVFGTQAPLDGEGVAVDGRVLERLGDAGSSVESGELVDHSKQRLEGHGRHGDDGHQSRRDNSNASGSTAEASAVGSTVANSNGRNASAEGLQRSGEHGCGESGELGDAEINGSRALDRQSRSGDGWQEPHRGSSIPGATNGFWRDADWLPCTDGKVRPTKPGLFPLAYGVAGRVGKLRAAGNAVCAPQAAEFIRTYLDI